MTKPRYRLAHDAALSKGVTVHLRENAAHYLTAVLRLKTGDCVALFNRESGEWRAVVSDIRKREVVLQVEEMLRGPHAQPFHLTVCFAPIKGGRMETIIEKATELGASVLQPVLTNRSIVDKVNLERAEAIAREAAEQCERIDWPEIREPVKLMKLLGDWPADTPLIYGDESGGSASILSLAEPSPENAKGIFGLSQGRGAPAALPAVHANAENGATTAPQRTSPLGEVETLLGVSGEGVTHWAILVGPEGGFAPEEFAALKHVKAARGVGLGPRILRADTAVITLCVATLMAWGDWHERPRFTGE